MDTDLVPFDDPDLLAEYRASDLRPEATPLPLHDLPERTDRWMAAVEAGGLRRIRAAGQAILDGVCEVHGVGAPRLSVLGARPAYVEEEASYELHGDYHADARRMRVWMRTAVHGRVVRPRTLLHPLLQELAHHLDVHALGFAESFHTRGFYLRVDALYHAALRTAPAARTRLAWRLVRQEGEAWWRFDPRSFHRRGVPDASGFARDWDRLGVRLPGH